MIKNWKILERKLVHQNVVFKEYSQIAESETGLKGNFVVIETLDWCNIIAENKKHEIYFVKQFRHGSNSLTIELPGGAINPREDINMAALRELREETGVIATEITKFAETAPNPAFIKNTCHYFYTDKIESVGPTSFDPLEEIEIVTIHKDKVIEMLRSGEIMHSLSSLCLLNYFLLQRP